jgi:adenylate kinase family enzyme
MPPMQRIWVIGISGSGKSTVAVELARRLGVPYVELDGIYHGPGWSEPDPDEFKARVAGIVAGESWVIDGGYQRVLGELVPEAADTVVWLDLPLHVTISRVVRRSGSRLLHRTELWNGNRESLRGLLWGRDSLIGWSIQQSRAYRRELPALFRSSPMAGTRIVRLRSAAAVRRWLAANAPVTDPASADPAAPAARPRAAPPG